METQNGGYIPDVLIPLVASLAANILPAFPLFLVVRNFPRMTSPVITFIAMSLCAYLLANNVKQMTVYYGSVWGTQVIGDENIAKYIYTQWRTAAMVMWFSLAPMITVQLVLSALFCFSTVFSTYAICTDKSRDIKKTSFYTTLERKVRETFFRAQENQNPDSRPFEVDNCHSK